MPGLCLSWSFLAEISYTVKADPNGLALADLAATLRMARPMVKPKPRQQANPPTSRFNPKSSLQKQPRLRSVEVSMSGLLGCCCDALTRNCTLEPARLNTARQMCRLSVWRTKDGGRSGASVLLSQQSLTRRRRRRCGRGLLPSFVCPLSSLVGY